MIPLRPSSQTKKLPILTWTLILSNISILIWLSVTHNTSEIFAKWAFTPALFFGKPESITPYITLFTSLFLHAGWLHLASNMIYLAAFGPIIESRLGRLRFALLYVSSGIAGMLLQGAVNTNSTVAIVGASGAIAGILGAVLLLEYHTKVTTLVPALVTIEIAELPAGFLVLVWMVLQLVSSIGKLAPGISSTAWYAHLGGLAMGALLATFLKIRKR